MPTVVITGGGRGLGADLSRAFHGAGFHVLIAARSDSGLAAELGDRARYEACDVRNPDRLHQVAGITVDWTGRLDVWINNAGYSAWQTLSQIRLDFWHEMLSTNLTGTLFGCQAAAAAMGEGGCLINISSLAGKRGSANNSAYCASKFGVNGVTQALAKELGPRRIRVNAVCPVYISTTGLYEALAEAPAPAGGEDIEGYLQAFAASQAALKRLPTGDEVAATCLFLASEAASAITGQCINVDCGVLPQ